MNTQNFNQSVGFPFQTETLSEMQTAYSIFNKLGDLAGNFSIISGCVVTGTNVSNGAVFIDGELLEFRGGTLGETVIIVQKSFSQEFQDAIAREVVFIRYATFGAGVVSFPWVNFKRSLPLTMVQPALDLKEDKTTITALLNRITALENKPSNIPIGLIAIWGGLFASIPNGWVEHVPLRGKMAIGQNPDDPDFESIGAIGGNKNQTLLPNNLPNPHGRNIYGFESDGTNTIVTTDITQNTPNLEKQFLIIPQDANKSFSIMNPYRIVNYIKYTGV